MLHRHDWVKVEGTVVEAPEPGLMSMTAGATWVAEVNLPGEGPFRAKVEPVEAGSRVRPPAAGTVTGFQVDMKSRKVRFDETDPRNHAAPSFGLGAGSAFPSAMVGIAGLEGLSQHQRERLDQFFAGQGGLASLIERTVAAAEGLGGMTVVPSGAPVGPKWDVPTHCPNCGAQVDQARAANESDPHCAFCQQAIPVTPHVQPGTAAPFAFSPPGAPSAARAATAPGAPAAPLVDHSHDQVGTMARILASGVAVQATLVSAGLLPGITNAAGENVMALTLEVTPANGGPPYQTQMGCHVPDEAFHLLVPGTVLPAKVMPDEPAYVAIDWSAAGSTGR